MSKFQQINGLAGRAVSGSIELPLPLNALRAFDLAAQKMSFAMAAKALSVTPPAISQQIKRLEQHIGFPLFVRHNRRIALTDAGWVMASRVRVAMRALEETLSSEAIQKIGGLRNGRQ